MAKKKSKAQKQKQNIKRKLKKQEKIITSQAPKKESITKQSDSKRTLVEKDKVIYNVPVTKKTSNNKINSKNNANNKNKTNNKQKSSANNSNKKVVKTSNKQNVYQINTIKKTSKSSKVSNSNKTQQKPQRPKTETIAKITTKDQTPKQKNIFIRLIISIFKNIHILFNAALIIIFAFLLIGLIRVEVFSKGTIIYISCIAAFLSIIAISYNRYISGKIFTIIICAMMSLGIYHLQYTYDFIRNLNEEKYEYKTYYVVALDNASNTSIYSINNKKVGLLTDNNTNVKRILNTKLDKIEYIDYTDVNLLFEDFFNQNIRALIVDANQYNYLKNIDDSSNKSIKILYDFKANSLK